MDNFGNLEFLDILTVLSFLLAFENFNLNEKQVNMLMQELKQNQDGMLEKIINQNELIIKQNEELLQLLRRNPR